MIDSKYPYYIIFVILLSLSIACESKSGFVEGVHSNNKVDTLSIDYSTDELYGAIGVYSFDSLLIVCGKGEDNLVVYNNFNLKDSLFTFSGYGNGPNEIERPYLLNDVHRNDNNEVIAVGAFIFSNKLFCINISQSIRAQSVVFDTLIKPITPDYRQIRYASYSPKRGLRYEKEVFGETISDEKRVLFPTKDDTVGVDLYNMKTNSTYDMAVQNLNNKMYVMDNKGDNLYIASTFSPTIQMYDYKSKKLTTHHYGTPTPFIDNADLVYEKFFYDESTQYCNSVDFYDGKVYILDSNYETMGGCIIRVITPKNWSVKEFFVPTDCMYTGITVSKLNGDLFIHSQYEDILSVIKAPF